MSTCCTACSALIACVIAVFCRIIAACLTSGVATSFAICIACADMAVCRSAADTALRAACSICCCVNFGCVSATLANKSSINVGGVMVADIAEDCSEVIVFCSRVNNLIHSVKTVMKAMLFFIRNLSVVDKKNKKVLYSPLNL